MGLFDQSAIANELFCTPANVFGPTIHRAADSKIVGESSVRRKLD
jgi:hypothetical protein